MRPLADVKDTSSVPSIEKIESASSFASGGRNSITDSAEDALEVALRQKHEKDLEKESIPLTLNNTKHGSDQDFDEAEDLFKPPSDGDHFFKVQSDTFQHNVTQNSMRNSGNDTVDSAFVNSASHSQRNTFTPSPSPLSNDGNLLNVNQSNINRENSVSSLSCDFSSGEEIQNSPGNPVVLSSGCDSLGQNGELLDSKTVGKTCDVNSIEKTDSGLDDKDIQGR